MVSDILTAIIVFLMAVLVVYPTTRILLQSWRAWRRRRGQDGEVAGHLGAAARLRSGAKASAEPSSRHRPTASMAGSHAPHPRAQRHRESRTG